MPRRRRIRSMALNLAVGWESFLNLYLTWS
jgi:hypothetical protein